ncbi:hypothetical protein M422DRAFT_246382 [Sphaerobolus stellatus SS14]|nr:hypothetical protein M422DRAFT_246382 [Sphaerobolus stellatus SS14]
MAGFREPTPPLLSFSVIPESIMRPPIDGDAPSSQRSTLCRHGTLPYTSMSSEPDVRRIMPQQRRRARQSESEGISRERIIKEGTIPTLIRSLFPILLGSLFSNTICYVLFASSTQAHLQSSITTFLSSALLTTLTRTFLLDPDFDPKQSKLLRTVEDHQGTFTNLKRDLEKAHSEWLGVSLVSTAVICGIGSRRKAKKGEAYDDAVDCLNRLALHLAGLRSGTRIQAELTRKSSGMGMLRKVSEESRKGKGNERRRSTSGSSERGKERESEQEEEDATLEAAASMFGDLVHGLGPRMSALAVRHLHSLVSLSYLPNTNLPPIDRMHNDPPPDQTRLRTPTLLLLLPLPFCPTLLRTRIHAPRRRHPARATMRSLGFIEGARWLNDSTFIFTIQELARELILLVQAMARIYAPEREENERKMVLTRLWGRWDGGGLRREHEMDGGEDAGKKGLSDPPLHPTLLPHHWHHHIAHVLPQSQASCPEHRADPRALDPHVPRPPQTAFMGLGSADKGAGHEVRGEDGLATAMLAASAFWEGTREVFLEYRGEWALLSICLFLRSSYF